MQNSNCRISKRDFIKKSLVLTAGMGCYPYSCVAGGSEFLQKGNLKREAMFQEESARGVMCRICPNECVLKEGEVSKCNNRIVYKSRLYTMAYGNPCSVNADPIEKKPLYHFLPGTRAYSIATAGCNLVCLNCQNWTISQTSPDKTRNYDLMPEKVVSESIKNNCKTIAYTYSEPTTFYEYMFETASLAKKSGVRNIIKSNGYINQEPLKKLCTVIDGANIDLKAFTEPAYLKLTGGKLQPVLDALKIYRDSGVWLEITNLVVPGWTDNLQEIRNMCKWLSKNGFSSTPLHLSRFYPVHKLEQLPPTPVSILNDAAGIAMEEGLKYVYTGNVPGNEISDTICHKCNATLVERKGFRVASNRIIDGKCPNCGYSIDGIWN